DATPDLVTPGERKFERQESFDPSATPDFVSKPAYSYHSIEPERKEEPKQELPNSVDPPKPQEEPKKEPPKLEEPKKEEPKKQIASLSEEPKHHESNPAVESSQSPRTNGAPSVSPAPSASPPATPHAAASPRMTPTGAVNEWSV